MHNSFLTIFVVLRSTIGMCTIKISREGEGAGVVNGMEDNSARSLKWGGDGGIIKESFQNILK